MTTASKPRPFWSRRERPPRVISIINPGRRSSDHWVAYLIIMLVILESLFVFYTAVRGAQASSELDRATDRQEQINNETQRQNTVLVCYAQKSDVVDDAITRLLIVQQHNPTGAEANAALEAVRAAQADKQSCGR